MIENILDRIKARHIIAVCAVIYVCGLTSGLSLNGDDSKYILTGKSFLERGFFHEVFVSPELARSSYYYFMLPLLLTPFLALAPSNYLLTKLIPLLSSVGAVVMLNILLKGAVPDRYRKAIILLFGISPWVLRYSNLILTDMPYIFMVLACFAAYKRYEEKRSIFIMALAAVLAGISFYTRPIGAALCLSLMLYPALKRRWRDCAVTVIVLVVMAVPVFLHIGDLCPAFINIFVARQDYYAYASPSADASHIAFRALRTLAVYAGSYTPDLIAGTAVSSIDPYLPSGRINPVFALKLLIGASMCGLVICGFRRTARDSLKAYHIYFVFHILMLLVISVYVARYLLPLFPFILIFMATAFESGKAKRKIAAAFFLIIAALSLAGSAREIVRARTGYLSGAEAGFVECNDWVMANTPPGAVILSRKPSYTNLYTGRAAKNYIIADDPSAQMKYITDNNIDFVIVGDLGFYLREAEYLERTVARYPGKFRLRYKTSTSPENFVYEVLKESGGI